MPGPSDPGLGFIEDEQHAALDALLLERSKIADGQFEDATARQNWFGNEGGKIAGGLAVDQFEGVIKLRLPVIRSIRIRESRTIGVRCGDDERASRCRAIAPAAGAIGRGSRCAGHSVPALGESDDLVTTGDELRHTDGRLVGFGARSQQLYPVETRRESCQPRRELDHGTGQHPGKQMRNRRHLPVDGGDDVGMGVPEQGAHLAGGEIEDGTVIRIINETPSARSTMISSKAGP